VERAVCLDQGQGCRQSQRCGTCCLSRPGTRLPSVSEAWNVLFVSTRDKATASLRGVERAAVVCAGSVLHRCRRLHAAISNYPDSDWLLPHQR